MRALAITTIVSTHDGVECIHKTISVDTRNNTERLLQGKNPILLNVSHGEPSGDSQCSCGEGPGDFGVWFCENPRGGQEDIEERGGGSCEIWHGGE